MIALENIMFGYKKKGDLFTDLQLNLPSGNIYGLLGKNGAGKTTMLKLISGLVFPQKGRCIVMGYEAHNRYPQSLQDIYIIPEEFYVPSIPIKIYQNLYAPFYPKFDLDGFYRYLEEFEIPQNKKLSSLSYGQIKKFLVSFGLATNCRLLLLDEPTNGLDIPSKSQFRKLLASTIQDDRCFLISTHQVRDMANLIDPIIILENGQIIFNYSVFEISQKLSFQIEQNEAAAKSVLHYEHIVGGFATISENTSSEETMIDIELLFNAVISKKEKINELFKNNGGKA